MCFRADVMEDEVRVWVLKWVIQSFGTIVGISLSEEPPWNVAPLTAPLGLQTDPRSCLGPSHDHCDSIFNDN